MSLLSELLAVKACTEGNYRSSNVGICLRISPGLKGEFRQLYCKWPKFSGDMAYPIVYGGDPAIEYNKFPLWGDNPYADLRRELLDWCIKELTENIGDSSAGDRFIMDGQEYILAQVSPGMFALISLRSGNRYKEAVKIPGVSTTVPEKYFWEIGPEDRSRIERKGQ